MVGNISNQPREWGGGNRMTQFDMDDLEVRKVRALERIADALDGHKTSKWSGVVSDQAEQKHTSKPASKGAGILFDVFRT